MLTLPAGAGRIEGMEENPFQDPSEKKRERRFRIGISILWVMVLAFTLWLCLHPGALKKAAKKQPLPAGAQWHCLIPGQPEKSNGINAATVAASAARWRCMTDRALACQPRDAVAGGGNVGVGRPVAVLHQVGVFRGVVIEIAQQRSRSKPLLAKEELGRQI